MISRKFSEVSVVHEIYCSSSFDHFVGIVYRENGEWRSRDFWIDGRALLGKRGLSVEIPQYFLDDILRGLLQALKDGVKVCEYDRDGNKRFEGLRYHDPEWIQGRIDSLTSYFESPNP